MSTQARTEEPPFIDRLDAVRSALRAVYRDVEEELARAGPVCELSGRCCRFLEYGHTLFISAPEALLLVADAPRPVRALDEGASCPWQDEQGRCTARDARPLGCRVYFCDPSFQARMPELAEHGTRRLKQLAAENDWPWDYAPLHHHLHRLFS